MPVHVLMPQLGESITEGTIVRWLKQVGDPVERDEPLFEISTDKVDAEVPAPAAGVLAEIRAREGETLPVDAVVAVIGQAAEHHAATGRPGATHPSPSEFGSGEPSETASGRPSALREEGAPARPRSSPFVRRLARERDVDLSQVTGTGATGRVTKHDLERHLQEIGRLMGRAVSDSADKPVVFPPGESTTVVPMSVMRRKIAEHMIASRRTSAHVHTVFEVDFTHVGVLRQAHRAAYERAGARLSFLPFIARTVADALVEIPVVNASVDGDRIVYTRDINLGVAVALDWGLIVPVVKHADRKSVLDLGREIADLAERARTKRLMPADVESGTFTITNPGRFGSIIGMPIINQPQVAILCVGAIERRPAVIGDALAIRARAYLTLGFDHRLIDGATADRFMARVKEGIEQFDPGRL